MKYSLYLLFCVVFDLIGNAFGIIDGYISIMFLKIIMRWCIVVEEDVYVCCVVVLCFLILNK